MEDVLQESAAGFLWESRYAQSWDILQEDSDGTLQPTLALLVQRDSEYLQRRRTVAEGALRRGIMRHVVLLLDWSSSVSVAASKNAGTSSDLSFATKLMRKAVLAFISLFFDQSPVSQLAILSLRDGISVPLSPMSATIADHESAVARLLADPPSGELSLQNGLRVARNMLEYVPAHGTREVVVLQFALSTVDPGDIFAEIVALRSATVRVSTVSYSGELAICARIAKETGGTCQVSLNDDHFFELLLRHVSPPEIGGLNTARSSTLSFLIQMGFPLAHGTSGNASDLCACHARPLISNADGGGGHTCPKCSARVCHLPCDCPICGLTLISAPHLAKSYHHLFPIPAYGKLHFNDILPSGEKCMGCNAGVMLADASGVPMHRNGFTAGRCPRCSHVFCYECNYFVHETLHNCPGCLI